MKPSIPKGTRDFSPAEVAKRQYIIGIIKANFEKFGYQPIETPSFENSETLMGKYGEEGDRLIFKILNSGDYLSDVKHDLVYAANISIYFFEILEAIKVRIEIKEEDSLVEYIPHFLTIYRTINADEKIILINYFVNNIELIINFYNENSFLELPEKVVDLMDFKRKIYGNFYKIYIEEFEFLNSKKATKSISEKALRYDLTVPFARYVVQHQNEIEFPFKRYQIQPVWRADRPQKGRFREFFQCDADVVGSNSLWQEIELIQLYDAVFSDLGLKGVTIKINNRKILSGIAEVMGAADKLIDFTVALDKLDKIGEDGVKKEMLDKGINENAIEKMQPLFNFTGTVNEKIEKLVALLSNSNEGKKGIDELKFICDSITKLGLNQSILDLDVTLARGLNYYTGAIFEVTPPQQVQMGSIGGGGRYDDLTGIFGLKNMSGVGISFGLDRIYLVLDELDLFPKTVIEISKALFLNFGDQEALYCMQAIKKLRELGIKVELYPDVAKIGKQFMHADKRKIPYAVIVGETEMNDAKFALKNLVSGTQVLVSFDELKQKLS